MPVATAEPDLLRGLAVAVGDAADAALAIAGSAARLSGDISPVLAVDPVARWGAAWARSLAERADLLEAMAPVAGRLIDAHHLARERQRSGPRPHHDAGRPLGGPRRGGERRRRRRRLAARPPTRSGHRRVPRIPRRRGGDGARPAPARDRRCPRVCGSTWSSPPTGRRIELAIAEIDGRLAGADPGMTVDLAAEREMLIGMLRRNFVMFDWSGDGHLAEWVGPLDADHVAVLVPGMSTDKLDVDLTAANAARMLRFDTSGDLAVVTALVYDAPDLVDATLPFAATNGIDGLARLVEVLPVSDRHLTLVGHSYGSLLLGTALAGGLAADLPPRHDIVSDGGDVTSQFGIIGSLANSTGTATVTGAGSTWTTSGGGAIFVGSHGTATLRIEGGGQVFGTDDALGLSFDGVGTAIVTGVGSSWTTPHD